MLLTAITPTALVIKKKKETIIVTLIRTRRVSWYFEPSQPQRVTPWL